MKKGGGYAGRDFYKYGVKALVHWGEIAKLYWKIMFSGWKPALFNNVIVPSTSVVVSMKINRRHYFQNTLCSWGFKSIKWTESNGEGTLQDECSKFWLKKTQMTEILFESLNNINVIFACFENIQKNTAIKKYCRKGINFQAAILFIPCLPVI